MPSTTERDLADLLARTGAAHGEYETRELGGRYDEDWATWYAAYLIDHGLNDLVGGAPRTAAGLRDELRQLDVDFKREQPAGGWPTYYARRLVGGGA
jgi:hypothetical protein